MMSSLLACAALKSSAPVIAANLFDISIKFIFVLVSL